MNHESWSQSTTEAAVGFRKREMAFRGAGAESNGCCEQVTEVSVSSMAS